MCFYNVANVIFFPWITLYIYIHAIYTYIYIYIYIHTYYMCPPGYHHNVFRATHSNIYIMLFLLLWDLIILCIMDHLWPLTYYIYINIYIYIYFFYIYLYYIIVTFEPCSKLKTIFCKYWISTKIKISMACMYSVWS